MLFLLIYSFKKLGYKSLEIYDLTIWYQDFSFDDTPSEKASFFLHSTDLGRTSGFIV